VRPTWLVWPGLTTVVLVAAAAIAVWEGSQDAARWIAFGIATSAVTTVAGYATVSRLDSKLDAWGRLVAETAIRMALPLGALMAVAVVRREMITPQGIAYFLPFQFVTLVAGVNRSLIAVKQTESS
jgi:hypothetical protein